MSKHNKEIRFDGSHLPDGFYLWVRAWQVRKMMEGKEITIAQSYAHLMQVGRAHYDPNFQPEKI